MLRMPSVVRMVSTAQSPSPYFTNRSRGLRYRFADRSIEASDASEDGCDMVADVGGDVGIMPG